MKAKDITVTNVTKGVGTLGTIYDRLRKRSQRRTEWTPERDDIVAVWEPYDHAAYVYGVRDALKAVEAEGVTCSGCGWQVAGR